jgi:hypothetical protein
MRPTNYLKIISTTFFLTLGFSCNPDKSREDESKKIVYDIFPVLGQSNVYYGSGIDSLLDRPDDLILQLGRYGANNLQLIPAREPMEHHLPVSNRNGFAMTFAKLYLQNYWAANRRVLLIPCAENGSSFRFRRWNKGDTLYNDAVNRIKYVLNKYPGSEVKAFLWHQGESDVYWGRDYTGLLDRMITSMRRDIAGPRGDSIPFVVGGFVPYWADLLKDRRITDSVIRETPIRLAKTGYANPRFPFVISKPNNQVDDIHFDAAGQREMGKRYFEEYKRLRIN